MHNTSSQLYKYVSNLIIGYFKSQKIQPGDRFNLYLEDKENIQSLYESLENDLETPIEQFSYTHPEGGEAYSTFSLLIEGTRVIIASSAFASEDYFTMLRNKVADQKEVFEGTAILILFSGKLDSLLGGSGSLIKEGMPLHYSRFKNHIEQDIEYSATLKKYEKQILNSVLDRKTKSVVEDNNSIFDYEQVINSLQKGTVDLKDFRFLGLFPQQELSSKNGDLSKDLNSNFALYEKFENIFLNGNPASDLEQDLPNDAISKLIKNDWHEFDYSEIVKWMDKEKEKAPPVFQTIKGDNLLQTLWYKTDGDSASKKRNVNLIVFNASLEYPFKVNVRYDQFIKKEDLNIKQGSKNINVTSSGYNIVIEFKEFDANNLFSLIEYKDSETEKRYLIRILCLPFNPTVISQFEGNFQLNVQKTFSYLQIKESSILVFNPDGSVLVNEILILDNTYEIIEDQKLIVNYDYSLAQEDLIHFKINLFDVVVPIAIKTDFEVPKPILGIDVWKEKRVHKIDFKYIKEGTSIKLLFKNNEKTVRDEFRNNLIQEEQIIYSEGYSWFLDNENIVHNNEIALESEIKAAFDKLRNYYKNKKTQPSLVYLNEELKQISIEYVSCFINCLEELEENKPLTHEQKNLLWLGVVKERNGEEKIKFSPLHPLNVAYQLQLNDDLKNEEIYNAILKRLSPYNLIPYIEGKPNEIYIPIESSHSPEWLYYTVYLNSKQAVPKTFVSNLVTDKIKDFTTNFEFLFDQSKKSPIKINAINLGDCKEVVEGIFDYYRRYLNSNLTKRLSDLLPMEISIYGSDKIVTKFEELTFYESADDVERYLGIELKTKNFEKEDLLNVFLDRVKFYSKKQPKKLENYQYSHITFYQFDVTKTEKSYDEMSLVKTGVSFNGLMADVSSTARVQNYRTGFGMKDLPEYPTELTKLSCLLNSFVRVASNGDPYERNKALCTTINYDIKEQLEKLYHDSQWVTYIDPKVDLDFFKESKDLVIIHYSDQYNNSNGYDAITVSRKTSQYEFVVKEFLEKHQVEFDTVNDTINIINFFNAINGEWLLKLIRQHSQFPREKLSLLSGIKSSLTFLHHPNIIWVPISLEEILRVSGNAGLNMGEGLFSTKNLGAIGSFSDDLLFIGLEVFEGKLLMHLYPVELKIGGLGIVKKGIDQGKRTAHLLYEHLQKEGFLSEFYKNFFAKIVLTNAEKMKLFHVWDTQNWNVITEHYRNDLLNNNFIISNRLNTIIGTFGLIHFGNDVFKRKISITSEFMRVDLQETDGYNFLVKSIDNLIHLFHETETTIDKNSLLINTFSNANLDVFIPIEPLMEEDFIIANDIAEEEPTELEEIHSKEIDVVSIKNNTGEGIEIVFGANLNNSNNVIWEPNNTNKVMHTNTGIIGTMGTGKTQFTKSLITQLNENANKNIGDEKLGILIFDYKGDYIKDDFVSKTHAKVLHPYHLPYNPLALDATEQSKPMLPLHTANDLKETIANAFNLGTVQKQRLRDVIVEAYEDKGINKAIKESWARTPPTLGDVCDVYLGSEKNSQDSLYAAISNLSEFEIFEPDPTKTQSLYSLIEGVVVINLSGYDESIQNLIVAITLDAFYTQMQRHGHSEIKGNNRQIKKMILVDEADNFLSKNFNSIRKILKEGREFGVGTILSTQFLNHFATSENEYSNYILTWVIHRVNEIKIKEVESLFSLDTKTQKENLIKTIKGLEKHQSIVNLAGSEPILIKDKAFWEL
ncbi:DNA phosphorothioation-dependent restriction protein DptH [Flavobacterium cheongpyeongense]|uniref:DNA phosphorothioation-dependent restriction protein DptH n=1 Tax=Flavobacterium cheongpyeongense TaxID=2212651 RepID=A0A2V4BPY6_9FLAO|nr:DNA phosphorothioation-dependent restriction protein DptH [Flavobacterium cheongpyeongense]PXY40602.1 DNA phosphorothioation-dependent restriction protein DptH [Flavobacterium cheongpyeongense]